MQEGDFENKGKQKCYRPIKGRACRWSVWKTEPEKSVNLEIQQIELNNLTYLVKKRAKKKGMKREKKGEGREQRKGKCGKQVKKERK